MHSNTKDPKASSHTKKMEISARSSLSEIPKILVFFAWVNALFALTNVFQRCPAEIESVDQLRIKRRSGRLLEEYINISTDIKHPRKETEENKGVLPKV